MVLVMIEHRDTHFVQILLSPGEVDFVNFVDVFDFVALSPLVCFDGLGEI